MSKLTIKKRIFGECILFEYQSFSDFRGNFSEIINLSEKQLQKLKFICKQINLVNSKKYVFRGFHYQIKKPQTKIIYCLKGKIIDVVVDIRKKSKTYMKFFEVELSDKDNSFLYIPKGFAHGYYTLEQNSQVIYLCNNFFSSKHERKIHYKNNDLNFNLPKSQLFKISEKDEKN